MQSPLPKIAKAIFVAVLIIFVLGLLLLLSPAIIYFGVKGFFENRSFEAEFQKFLNENEGLKLFCYNNRRISCTLIEKEIIPLLPQDIKVVFLEGKKPVSEFDERIISRVLYSIQGGRGLPYVLKIKDGSIYHHSLHKELYDRISQKRDLGSLIQQILSF